MKVSQTLLTAIREKAEEMEEVFTEKELVSLSTKAFDALLFILEQSGIPSGKISKESLIDTQKLIRRSMVGLKLDPISLSYLAREILITSLEGVEDDKRS